MLNIISKSHNRLATSGPKKVVDNLVKGLDLIAYPYVINRRLDACQRLWVHDDVEALWQINSLPAGIKVVIGPNLFVKPSQIPKGLDLSRAVYLQPSVWALDFWKTFGFSQCPLEAWPTGIDTDEFAPTESQKDYVLVYFKQRFKSELISVLAELKKRGLKYKLLVYPEYTEKEYKEFLAAAKFAIWIGRQESQGIALEEALSWGVPIIIWDVMRLGHWEASKKEMSIFTVEENNFARTTSAEYFDETCGIKIKNLNGLQVALDNMESNWRIFKPREFILKNLGLEKQARDFIEIFQYHFGLAYKDGLKEKLLKVGKWKNDSLFKRIKFWVKDGAKTVIKICRRLIT